MNTCSSTRASSAPPRARRVVRASGLVRLAEQRGEQQPAHLVCRRAVTLSTGSVRTDDDQDHHEDDGETAEHEQEEAEPLAHTLRCSTAVTRDASSRGLNSAAT